jgi:hypothetical protein
LQELCSGQSGGLVTLRSAHSGQSGQGARSASGGGSAAGGGGGGSTNGVQAPARGGRAPAALSSAAPADMLQGTQPERAAISAAVGAALEGRGPGAPLRPMGAGAGPGPAAGEALVELLDSEGAAAAEEGEEQDAAPALDAAPEEDRPVQLRRRVLWRKPTVQAAPEEGGSRGGSRDGKGQAGAAVAAAAAAATAAAATEPASAAGAAAAEGAAMAAAAGAASRKARQSPYETATAEAAAAAAGGGKAGCGCLGMLPGPGKEAVSPAAVGRRARRQLGALAKMGLVGLRRHREWRRAHERLAAGMSVEVGAPWAPSKAARASNGRARTGGRRRPGGL